MMFMYFDEFLSIIRYFILLCFNIGHFNFFSIHRNHGEKARFRFICYYRIITTKRTCLY